MAGGGGQQAQEVPPRGWDLISLGRNLREEKGRVWRTERGEGAELLTLGVLIAMPGVIAGRPMEAEPAGPEEKGAEAEAGRKEEGGAALASVEEGSGGVAVMATGVRGGKAGVSGV